MVQGFVPVKVGNIMKYSFPGPTTYDVTNGSTITIPGIASIKGILTVFCHTATPTMIQGILDTGACPTLQPNQFRLLLTELPAIGGYKMAAAADNSMKTFTVIFEEGKREAE